MAVSDQNTTSETIAGQSFHRKLFLRKNGVAQKSGHARGGGTTRLSHSVENFQKLKKYISQVKFQEKNGNMHFHNSVTKIFTQNMFGIIGTATNSKKKTKKNTEGPQKYCRIPVLKQKSNT